MHDDAHWLEHVFLAACDLLGCYGLGLIDCICPNAARAGAQRIDLRAGGDVRPEKNLAPWIVPYSTALTVSVFPPRWSP